MEELFSNTGLVSEYPKDMFLEIFERMVTFVWTIMSPFQHERARRILVGTFAMFCGRGGIATVHKVTGVSEHTIDAGIAEIKDGSYTDTTYIRRPGGGRKRKDEMYSILIDCVVQTQSYGDPMRVCCHTTFSTYTIADAVSLMIDILMGNEEGDDPQDSEICDRIQALIVEAHKTSCEVAILFVDTLCRMKLDKVPLDIETIDELYNDLTETARKEAELREAEAAQSAKNATKNNDSGASNTEQPISSDCTNSSGTVDKTAEDHSNKSTHDAPCSSEGREASAMEAHNSDSQEQEDSPDSTDTDIDLEITATLEQLLEAILKGAVPESSTGTEVSSPSATSTPSAASASTAPSAPSATSTPSAASDTDKADDNNKRKSKGKKKSERKTESNGGSNQTESPKIPDGKEDTDGVGPKDDKEAVNNATPDDTSDKSSQNSAVSNPQQAKFEARTSHILNFACYEVSGQVFDYLFTDDEHRPKFKSNYGSVSPSYVRYTLDKLHYSKQQNQKLLQVGKEHPQRDRQFRLIKQIKEYCLKNRVPFLSLDVKKKEQIGFGKIPGKIYRSSKDSVPADDHDFPKIKMIPLGIWDLALGKGYMFLNISHDTAEYTLNCLKYWWDSGNNLIYSDAPFLVLQCDCGGSNGKNHRTWHNTVQEFANYIGKPVFVCHTPPGASKWNPIEHLFFPHVSRAFQAQLLTSLEKTRDILNTMKVKGKSVCKAVIDSNEYETGVKISDEVYATFNIVRPIEPYDLNYIVFPNRNILS